MLSIATLLLAPTAQAGSDIEFKTNGPVLVYVDGQQATLTSKMRLRVSGLEAGTHEVRVTGVFGKTLYEAEIDVPDNTMTWAEWERGELNVLKTDWLSADNSQASEEVAAVPAEPASSPIVVAPPLAPPVAVPPVATAPPPVAVPPVAAAPPPVAAPPVAAAPPPVAVPPVAAAPPPVAAAPVVASAPTPVAAAVASPRAPGQSLSVQARDGMQIELVLPNGERLMVTVDGTKFRIQDQTGMEMTLGR